MVKINEKIDVSLKLTFEVSEPEARALEAMAGYGDDAFVKAFYDKLGKAYMDKHEAGLRAFLKSMRETLPNILFRVDEARKAIKPN